MDLRLQLDQMIDGLGRLSLLAQLRDKVVEIAKTGRRECGNCNHWMKKGTCPQEGGLGSGMGGPSMGSLACGKFEMTESTKRLRAQRIDAAVAFAQKYKLPIPGAMQ